MRALFFDRDARRLEGYSAQADCPIRTTPDGGAELDPAQLTEIVVDCLDEAHRLTQVSGLRVAAVGVSAFWHGLMGVDDTGAVTVPVLHPLDTRSGTEVAQVPDTHARTGCVPHSSYWPAKLLWLERSRPEAFHATRRWMGFPEYLFQQLFGKGGASVSMASATGLWNQCGNDYDAPTLAALPLERGQLAEPREMDRVQSKLAPKFARLWPAFAGTKWFPALGDGACDHLGSAGTETARFSLMAGTTGALRAMLPRKWSAVPHGAFAYRLDRERMLVGGALSNAGDVFAWLKRTLALPKDLEARLERAVPGQHGLTLLPFLAGERTPYWRSDLRGAMAGLSFATEPFDIFQAALEAVALGFREIYEILTAQLGAPTEVIASGGALARSPGWTQMIADALGRPITVSIAPEASSRGAALYALQQLGVFPGAEIPTASTGQVIAPRAEYLEPWREMAQARGELYGRLFERTA